MRAVILGTSGHAKVLIDIVEKQGLFEIVGLIGPTGSANSLLGYKLLGHDEQLPELAEKHQFSHALIGIGDNWRRHEVAEQVKRLVPDLALGTAIHPSAQIARDVEIGAGTVVMAGVCINAGAVIGRLCILNTCASVDHDSVLEDFSSVAPGARLGGHVRVGQFAAVCLGASAVHRVRIGEHSVLGAGALALSDVPPNVVAYGVPARVIRPRQPGELYL